ncbi:type VI secretion system protein TssA [Cupriavidus sp. USMAHM13]|uniref:type VI secretion system protein TssA n=1 Tax=Cupriavidus sp. USMAHM13 TaxID=1389192 RepID=UPI000B192F81|nr:type VI secretion system protein TssA [Cupriavidus sp. USMAHM13]
MINLPPLDLDALLGTLDAKQPAGVFDEEDETYQGIEHEMVKLGSLGEANIDWSYVDEASRQYLSTQCKHFRVAGHLVTARLRPRTWPHWTEAMLVLAGMVERYWETSQPKPGPRGLLAKRKLLALLVERLSQALEALDRKTYNPGLQDQAQRAFDRLQAEATAAQLDVSMLSRLEAQMHRHVESTLFPEPVALKPSDGQQGGRALSDAFFQPSEVPKSGDEREGRRTLLTMAEFINEQDIYDPAGYQLRRFALWAHLRTTPPAKRDQFTELMCVPVDTEESYREAISTNSVSPLVLLRVEKSVTSSPYWLRGSFFAAAMAARLEMPAVAEAIRHAAERFLLRLPGLSDLRFADGRPFVDRDTLGWIGNAEARPAAARAPQEFAELREELASRLDTEGVEPVLRRLQAHQATSSGPRQRCHATVIAADLLKSRGLDWLAEELYANASRLMKGVTVDQWEPELFQHLAKHVPAQQENEHRRSQSQGERK